MRAIEIFIIDDEDKNRFIDILFQKNSFRLWVICLLYYGQSCALLINEAGHSLNSLMKRIGVTYASYFNKKYKRVGHVFQDRL